MQKRIRAWPGKPGEAWRITYQPDNPNNRVVHIRAIVDGDAIVCAVHHPRHGWRHVIEYRVLFDLMFERGELKRSRAKWLAEV